MGRAVRWLRALFGGKKPTPQATSAGPKPAAKEKKRWGSFVKSFRENDKTIDTAAVEAAAPYDEEQNKRAIAVAAATAAVAEAAVAAAQAAAAVVRLTSSGRVAGGGGGKRAEVAAVKIQATFRAYLARRAFRALKGLVKLQAIVRGNIVRKQAAETFRCMQALVRVQARARACRALRSDRDQVKLSSRMHLGPLVPEKSEQSVRSNTRKAERSSPLKRTPSKQTSSNDGLDQERSQSSSGYRWLDQWMEERYWDTANSEMIAMTTPLDDEKNAKILEIDTGKPHYNPKRKTNSFATVSESPSKDSTIVDMQQQTPSPLRFQLVDGCDFEDSPQFFSASSRPTGSRGPFTPTKSECSRSLFSGYSDYPNYMANTESSRAKVRSQSAPKQRPEFEKSVSIKRGYGGGGGGQQSQRSSSYKAYPGSGRLDRLGMPIRI